jgi:hypothetical protein
MVHVVQLALVLCNAVCVQADVVAAGISWPAYSLRMAKEEGFMAFYKGFGFNWARLTGFNLALFVSFEQIKKLCGAPAV